ncbi:Na+/H+ antiporter NhaA [Curvivirga sp.]|uniref:Na+/H+ antiporter NhaA n=1 Tax=Curvivirga sp. TaxID=2856848 RepID=UPI003B5BCB7D
MNKEVISGLVLVAAAGLAILIYNSPYAVHYDDLLRMPVTIGIGELVLTKSLLHFINDGLMALFFMYVGLEIKYEFVKGNLSKVSNAILPAGAAVGGMAVPAVIYAVINMGDPTALNGWAIPAATDIAFALGILAILGRRVPPALKVFLLTLAILDDLGAIIVIAMFYTADLSFISIGLAFAGLGVLAIFNFAGVTRISPYMLVGAFIWLAVLKSGVHATLAGVAIAMLIPLKRTNHYDVPPLKIMEHSMSPWVMFFIMPVFAFANAGVSLKGIALADLFAAVPLGIAAGLFLGKQIGVFGTVFAFTKLGISSLPAGVSYRHIYGAALLAGIGFTMSLFIGALAFSDPVYEAQVRIGVLSGSILSAIVGYFVLRTTPPVQSFSVKEE